MFITQLLSFIRGDSGAKSNSHGTALSAICSYCYAYYIHSSRIHPFHFILHYKIVY